MKNDIKDLIKKSNNGEINDHDFTSSVKSLSDNKKEEEKKNSSSVEYYSQYRFLKLLNTDFKNLINSGRGNELIGKEVALPNRYVIDELSVFTIADFNHDDTDCTIDLISKYVIDVRYFDSKCNNYVDSDIRAWLNYTYFEGFYKSVKNAAIEMDVDVTSENGFTTVKDKVKLLSIDELGITTKHENMPVVEEGNPYPIFTKGSLDDEISDRWRSGAYDADLYWTRSRGTGNTSGVWFVTSSGNLSGGNYYNSRGVVPVLRFQAK